MLRESLPNRKQMPVALGATALASIVAAAATASVGAASEWWGGFPTKEYVDAGDANQHSGTLRMLFGTSDLRDGEVDKLIENPVVPRVSALELSRREESERIGVVVRERVGLKVALSKTLVLSRLNESQRTSIERSALEARRRFDELVLQGHTPEQAAAQVLEETRIQ